MLTTELRRFFPASPVIALDIETTGLSITGDSVTAISLSDGKDAVVVDVRAIDPENRYSSIKEWLHSTVYDRRVIVHNGQFDLPMLHHNYGCGYPADVWDTKLAEQLITAGELTSGNSLKAVAQRRLGITLDKAHDVRTGFGLDNEWTPEQIAYAEADSRVLVPIMQAQAEQIVSHGLDTVWDIETRCLPLFAEMERRGIRLDVANLRKLLGEVENETGAHEAALQRLLTPHIAWDRMRIADDEKAALETWQQSLADATEGYGMMWDSCREDDEWWQLVHRDYDGMQLGEGRIITADEVESWREGANALVPVECRGRKRYVKRMVYLWRREAGNERPPVHVPTLDAPINLKSQQQMTAAVTHYLREWKAKISPPADWKAQTLSMWLADAPEAIREELKPLVLYKKGAKILDAFGDKLLSKTDRDGTLHGRYQQIGTATGRPTCSDPNLLQVPSDVKFRRCFIPRDGCLFVVADFSQIELRIMAQFSHDEAMCRAFREGLDLHRFSAAGIYGIPMDQVTDKQRKVGKIGNFAILYGVGPMTMRRQIAAGGQDVSMTEAKAALDGWRSTYPQAAALIQQWGEDALGNGFTASAWGRRRNFTRIWGDRTDRDSRAEAGIIRRAGANHPIQGTSADITKLAMVFIADRIAALGGTVLGQVYDEIIVEAPAENAAEAAIRVSGAMQDAAKCFITDIPVETDCTISPSWAEEDGIKLSDYI